MKEQKSRYYKFSEYLRKYFGVRVHKVTIDAGFSCPNKDGTKSSQGCIYCDNRGFSYPVRNTHQRQGSSNGARILPKPIESQIKQGIEFARRRFKAEKFIAYFQAYTNTYAGIDVLKQTYDNVRKFDDIVAISIGTRPDCVDEDILDLIQTYTRDYEVWIEYGLQSIHNKTLKLINRGHLYEDFLKAIEMTKKRQHIKICSHVIIGLPDEAKEDMLKTAKALGELKIDGVKIHPLHVIKGTKLEELYKEGSYKPLRLDEYVHLAVEFLEFLSPDTVIQRITADCPREFLVVPEWILDKSRVLQEIEKRLLKEERFQGRLC